MFSYPNQQEHNDMIDLMRGFANTGRPQVGIFWYDYAHNTLFGVQKDDADRYVDESIGTIPQTPQRLLDETTLSGSSKRRYWFYVLYRNQLHTNTPRTHLCMSGRKSICNRRTLDKRRNQRDTNCQCRCSP